MARGHRGRTIDFKNWDSMPGSVLQSSAVGTKVTGSFLSFTRPCTILRVRARIWGALDATKQVGDEFSSTIGLGIVSTDAFTAGAASMPDPDSEPGYPWMWWSTLDLRSEVAAASEDWGISQQIIEVDTKAMRRVQPEQTLVYVIQHILATGAPVTNFCFGTSRVLVGT